MDEGKTGDRRDAKRGEEWCYEGEKITVQWLVSPAADERELRKKTKTRIT